MIVAAVKLRSVNSQTNGTPELPLLFGLDAQNTCRELDDPRQMEISVSLNFLLPPPSLPFLLSDLPHTPPANLGPSCNNNTSPSHLSASIASLTIITSHQWGDWIVACRQDGGGELGLGR